MNFYHWKVFNKNMRFLEIVISFRIWVLLTSVHWAHFKESKLRNYFLLKKSNSLIFDSLNAQLSVKTYYIKSLKSSLTIIVTIFLEDFTISLYLLNNLSQSYLSILSFSTSRKKNHKNWEYYERECVIIVILWNS